MNDHKRRMWVAVVLNMFVAAGLGELYAGRPLRALWTFLALNSLAVVVWAPLWFRGPGILVLLFMFCPILLGWALLGIRGAQAAREAPDPYELRWYNRWWVYVIIVALLFFTWRPLVLKRTLPGRMRAFRVPSSSMEPFIRTGDYLYVYMKPGQLVRRNDVVVYSSMTQRGVAIIKRVVGMPGDSLLMRGGVLIVNGHPASEPFVQHVDPRNNPADDEMSWQLHFLAGSADSIAHHPRRDDWGPLVVPTGSYFVLGDNRDNSYDSRYWGFVPADHMLGKPLIIYFSIAEGGLHRIGTRLDQPAN